MRRFAGGAVAALVAGLLLAAPAAARVDYSGQAYNILAPGEFGGRARHSVLDRPGRCSTTR